MIMLSNNTILISYFTTCFVYLLVIVICHFTDVFQWIIIKYLVHFVLITDKAFLITKFQRKTKQNSRLSLIVKLSFPYNTRVDIEVSQWDTCTILGYVVSKIRVFNHGIFTIKYNIYPIKLKWHRYFAKMSWNVKCNIKKQSYHKDASKNNK
jgi:hypothetical protein